MLKHVIYSIGASLLVILSATYLNQALQMFMHCYTLLTGWFADIFSSSHTGLILTQLFSLFLVPLIITGVIAGAYWAFKRKSFPVFNEVLWVLWVMLATLFVMAR